MGDGEFLEMFDPIDGGTPRVARKAASEFARHCISDHAKLADIALCVSEAVTNVVVHAYRDRPEPGRVRLHAAVVDGVLEVAVADDGVGLVPRPDSPGLGLGIPTMNALADEVVVEGHATGTTLRLRFSLTG